MVLSGDTLDGRVMDISTFSAVLSSIFLIFILPLSFALIIEEIKEVEGENLSDVDYLSTEECDETELSVNNEMKSIYNMTDVEIIENINNKKEEVNGPKS